MPNWCEGTLKVRGTKENLTNFILNGLQPVGFLGEEKPKLNLNEHSIPNQRRSRKSIE